MVASGAYKECGKNKFTFFELEIFVSDKAKNVGIALAMASRFRTGSTQSETKRSSQNGKFIWFFDNLGGLSRND